MNNYGEIYSTMFNKLLKKIQRFFDETLYDDKIDKYIETMFHNAVSHYVSIDQTRNIVLLLTLFLNILFESENHTLFNMKEYDAVKFKHVHEIGEICATTKAVKYNETINKSYRINSSLFISSITKVTSNKQSISKCKEYLFDRLMVNHFQMTLITPQLNVLMTNEVFYCLIDQIIKARTEKGSITILKRYKTIYIETHANNNQEKCQQVQEKIQQVFQRGGRSV